MMDTWFEDFSWIDKAGVIVVFSSGEGGEGVWCSFFEVVACSEAEALADGGAAEMCVAGC